MPSAGRSCEAVCFPYAVEVPYWTKTEVASPFGLTVPDTVAWVVPIADAAPVVASGGFGASSSMMSPVPSPQAMVVLVALTSFRKNQRSESC